MVSLKPFYDGKLGLKVEAKLERDGDQLLFSGVLGGEMSHLIIPKTKEGERRYDLWDHTCFELFILKKGSEDYIEFNFAPSGDWNCFYISSYRENEGEYMEMKGVEIQSGVSPNQLQITARFSLEELPYLTSTDLNEELLVGFTAVVEDVDKSINYWALSHHGETPDFHDAKSFHPYKIGVKNSDT